EAEALVESGGAAIVETAESFSEKLERFTIGLNSRNTAGKAAARFVDERKGATSIIVQGLDNLLTP
ncbi:MAG: 3-deoxy-D-manno-octulosonic acid transferase, partial [Chlorobiaceae bacterium]|nr:3-deoxy-D-manno-octulosonic acid transferase [Chlorobiaceae bacterium]